MEIFSCLLDTFPVLYVWELFFVNLIVFAVNNFHKQLYVKAAIWEIALCSTCRKQSEYFDVERFLTCYIYNRAFCGNILRLGSNNSYYDKELHHRLGKETKVYLFW